MGSNLSCMRRAGEPLEAFLYIQVGMSAAGLHKWGCTVPHITSTHHLVYFLQPPDLHTHPPAG
jgi:hypothetical protein